MKDKLIMQSIQRRVTPFGSVLEEVPVQQADDETYARIMSTVVIPEPIVPTGWNSECNPRWRIGNREQ
jgi:hypothetical protein